MADIYEPNFMKNDALNQYFRTTRQLSGKAPRKSILQDIIGSEVDKAAANWRAANAQRIQQQQFNTTFGENQRQFNTSQQNAADTAAAARKAAETQGYTNLAGQLGSSYLLYRGLKPSTPTPAGTGDGIVTKITKPIKDWWNKPDAPAENLSDIPSAQPQAPVEVPPNAPGMPEPVDIPPVDIPPVEVPPNAPGMPPVETAPVDAVTIAGEETLPAAAPVSTALGTTEAGGTTLTAPVGQTSAEFSAGTGEMLGAAESGVAAAEGGATFGGAVGGVMPYAWIPAAAMIGGKLLESAGGGYDREKDSGTTAARVGASMQNVWQGFGPTSTEILFGKNYLGGATETANIAQDIINPGGFLARSIGCIIITACTDRNSPEVNIAREYRDKCLDQDQLRGYYYVAEKLVPFIESNRTVKRMVKKWLVDRLIDYGAVQLGIKPIMALRSSWIVSRAFLTLIRLAGKMKKQFVRVNGEVY